MNKTNSKYFARAYYGSLHSDVINYYVISFVISRREMINPLIFQTGVENKEICNNNEKTP